MKKNNKTNKKNKNSNNDKILKKKTKRINNNDSTANKPESENINKSDLFPKKFQLIKDYADIQDLNPHCNYVFFTSINHILFLVYASGDYSISCYNLIGKVKINEIKNCHTKIILSLEHIYDSQNKKDLILSLSNEYNIKVWDINNLELITNIKIKNLNDGEDGYVYSSCRFFQVKNKIYIVSYLERLIIEIFDLNGYQIKAIKDYSLKLYVYYDKYLDKNYIINLKMQQLYSYDFTEDKIYLTYKKVEGIKATLQIHSILIIGEKNLTKLIAIGYSFINIFDFHSSTKIKEIKFNLTYSKKMCLWNNKCLLMINSPKGEYYAGKENNGINMIDLEKGIVNYNIISFKKFYLFFISKITHPFDGECLMVFGYDYKFQFFKEKK